MAKLTSNQDQAALRHVKVINSVDTLDVLCKEKNGTITTEILGPTCDGDCRDSEGQLRNRGIHFLIASIPLTMLEHGRQMADYYQMRPFITNSKWRLALACLSVDNEEMFLKTQVDFEMSYRNILRKKA
ncbi:hypothetical protein KIN20_021893 [Parelaphostrongylus tenuis]|uniref:Uncharacterized protein n=1 Tax=Parelaphostrongylus tenuis TaxID=148309 RepID=A0AAD5QV04_PARTN|nr:hypothetical protein KIN20_021893 [Parelaphostrongylus tenuis]